MARRPPSVSGRAFTAEEASADAPVAVISETTARALWPRESAIGQRLQLVSNAQTSGRLNIGDSELTVVGVSRDHAADVMNSGPAWLTVDLPIPRNIAGAGLI